MPTTTDGKEFDCEEEALKHQANIDRQELEDERMEMWRLEGREADEQDSGFKS